MNCVARSKAARRARRKQLRIARSPPSMACAGILETGTRFITVTIRCSRGGMKTRIDPWINHSRIIQVIFPNESSVFERKAHQPVRPVVQAAVAQVVQAVAADRAVAVVKAAAVVFNDRAQALPVPATRATSSAIRSGARR